MTFINLLEGKVRSSGARFVEGGIEVLDPWGVIELDGVWLNEGWYEFFVEGEGAALRLQLEELDQFRIVDLEATVGNAAIVKLAQGQYRLSVMAGGRPGVYHLKGAAFRSFSAVRRYRLLASRLVQALLSGVSPGKIIGHIRRALSKGSTYGIRARAVTSNENLGVLSRNDLVRQGIAGDYSQRLSDLGAGPVLWVVQSDGRRINAEELKGQAYTRYILDPAQPHDFVVTIAPGDILMPDALLLFAEHIHQNPDVNVILADVWIGQRPTARVAWDPILYGSGVPMPYACRRGASPSPTFVNQADFSIISVPVAVSLADADYKEFQTPSYDSRPPCSIIIPTRDRVDLLEKCLAGLFEKTDWPHEVIIVDNGSVEPETFDLFAAYADRGVQIIRADIPFNFSTLCNLGARAAHHDYLVFLNNDVVLHKGDWLENMMKFAMMPEVGVVGARLLYADDRLQHGGVMLGLTQLCGHLWRGLTRDLQDCEPRLKFSSTRSAVTGACFCLTAEKFDLVGGFNETDFAVTLNDVDLCLRIMRAGLLNVYAAKAEAYHLEGESRGDDERAEKKERRLKELRHFACLWQSYITHDAWLPVSGVKSQEFFSFR